MVVVTGEIVADNEDDGEDAEDTLESLDLASLSRDLDTFHENEAVQEALARNVDLTAYSKTTDAELAELHESVVAHHFREVAGVAVLAGEMDKCGDMLFKMQQMLQVFQRNLSQVSAEMKRLQGSCEELETKLNNRAKVERRVRKFIERILVSPALKHTISTAPVKGAVFAKALVVVDEKITFIRYGPGAMANNIGRDGQASSNRAKSETTFMSWLAGLTPSETVSVQQVIPDLEELRRAAVMRIQEFFVSIFTDIRQAEGEQGAQMMLQNSLQKHTVRCVVL